jgi:hypothetical protein
MILIRLVVEIYFTPHGRYVHIPPPEPTANWEIESDLPWWEDSKYVCGNLSSKTRRIRIINVLSKQEDELAVCAEETLEEIRRRYLQFNSHSLSYTWKRLGRPLNMSKTLEENGIEDETDELEELHVDEDAYIPAIHVYFNDDLTVK